MIFQAVENISYKQVSSLDRKKAEQLYEGEALQKLDQGLDLNPYNPMNLWCKGSCLLWSKILLCIAVLQKYNDALIWIDQALEINPLHVQSLYSKGECLSIQQQINLQNYQNNLMKLCRGSIKLQDQIITMHYLYKAKVCLNKIIGYIDNDAWELRKQNLDFIFDFVFFKFQFKME